MAILKRVITPNNLSSQFIQDATSQTIKINVDGTSILANATTGVISSAIDPAIVNSLVALSGLPALSNDLGTFTGATIADASTVKAALQSLETALEAQNITGQFAGSGNTLATIPVTTADGKPVNNSDWAVLTSLDGTNIPGIYSYNGTAWVFVKEIPAQFALAATVAPLNNNLTAVVGVSDKYAREDHQHAFQGVSTDAGQMLTVGTDGKHQMTLDPVVGNLLKKTATGAAVNTADVLALHLADAQIQDAFGVDLFFGHVTTNM